MNEYFRRQLAAYAAYHRNGLNCASHYVGIPAIFLAVLIPLALWPVSVGSFNLTIGTLLLGFAAMIWIALDAGVGTAMLAFIVPLDAAADWIARSGSVARVMSIAAGLFVVGWVFQIAAHALFEHRKPAFLDDASQMFIGPMFITAKILVALGLRRDLLAPLNGCDAAEIVSARPTNDSY